MSQIKKAYYERAKNINVRYDPDKVARDILTRRSAHPGLVQSNEACPEAAPNPHIYEITQIVRSFIAALDENYSAQKFSNCSSAE